MWHHMIKSIPQLQKHVQDQVIRKLYHLDTLRIPYLRLVVDVSDSVLVLSDETLQMLDLSLPLPTFAPKSFTCVLLMMTVGFEVSEFLLGLSRVGREVSMHPLGFFSNMILIRCMSLGFLLQLGELLDSCLESFRHCLMALQCLLPKTPPFTISLSSFFELFVSVIKIKLCPFQTLTNSLYF